MQVFGVLRDYSPAIEPLSIDEAFLDVSHHASATWVAQDIRARVREELGLTASAGAAPVKMVAKIASGFRKPDGLTVVPPHQVRAFLDPLPVGRLWGVGPVTAGRLQAQGVRTIGDLAHASPERLAALFGRHGPRMGRLARGEDTRPVCPHRERKSRSAERTFAEDLLDVGVLIETLRAQSERVCRGLDKAGQRGRTVTLKLRYGDFRTVHPLRDPGPAHRRRRRGVRDRAAPAGPHRGRAAPSAAHRRGAGELPGASAAQPGAGGLTPGLSG